MNINLEYYKIFYYVGKLGRITAAADVLSVSQSAISQAIRHLEEQLNTALFLRTAKGVHLTAEGQLLYRYISQGYELMETGEKQLQRMLQLDTGEVRIGASDMTLQFYLLPYLETFHEKYPGIKVSVTNAPTPETLQYMREEKIDFGVVSTPLQDTKDLNLHPVKSVHDIFIAGPKYRRLTEKILDFHELENQPVICLEKNTSTRRSIDELLQKKGITLYPEFELATSDMIVQFTLRNLGIGYVMSEFAQPYIRMGMLFPLIFHEPTPSREFTIITHKQKYLSSAAKHLLQMLLS